eukprot:1117277_1
MLLALVTIAIYCVHIASSLGPLPILSFYVHDNSVFVESGTKYDVIATLWFNFTLYEYTMRSPGVGAIQTSTTNDLNIIDEYNCTTQSNSMDEIKLVVENNSADSITLDRIKLMTASGTWYGIEAACITQQQMNALSQLDPPPPISPVSTCTSGFARQWICIDNEPTDCGPYKQIFYFDTLRPNEYITDAYYADATHIVAQFDSCQPTISPTLSPPTMPPSISPTTLPTMPPMVSPTFLLTMPSTISSTLSPILPTILPTMPPTISPTILPTKWSTINPTLSPSKLSIINPTLTPTVSPTRMPTIHQTHISTAEPTVNPNTSPANEPTSVPRNAPTSSFPPYYPSVNPSKNEIDTYVSSTTPIIMNTKTMDIDEPDTVLVVIFSISTIAGLVICVLYNLKRKQKMTEQKIKGMHIPYKGSHIDENDIRSKVNALSKIPISAFVTKQGTADATVCNDKALDEIEGEQKVVNQVNVRITYTCEGPNGSDDIDVVSSHNEGGTAYVTNPTSKGDAIDAI